MQTRLRCPPLRPCSSLRSLCLSSWPADMCVTPRPGALAGYHLHVGALLSATARYWEVESQFVPGSLEERGRAGIWVPLRQRVKLTLAMLPPHPSHQAHHFSLRLSQRLNTKCVHQPGWWTSSKQGGAGVFSLFKYLQNIPGSHLLASKA